MDPSRKAVRIYFTCMNFTTRLWGLEQSEKRIMAIIQRDEMHETRRIETKSHTLCEERQRIFLDNVPFKKGDGLWVYTSRLPLLPRSNDDDASW